MTKKTILTARALTLIITVLGLVVFAVPAAAIPQPPHVFYGAVTVRGRPAPDGLTVTARINGASFSYPVVATTSGGRYGDDLTFRVPADDPETATKEGGVNGDTVVFYVDGVRAGTYTFAVGGVSEVNLAIFEPPARAESLPDPSALAMVGSGLAAALLYFGLSRLRRKLSRN